MMFLRYVAVVTALLWTGCGPDSSPRSRSERPTVEAEETLFTKLLAAYTNADFTNDLTYPEDTTIFTYRNYHTGGVGFGDFNGDGRQDLYFTANQDWETIAESKPEFSNRKRQMVRRRSFRQPS